MNLYESLEQILNKYLIEKGKPFKGNEFNKMMTVDLPEIFYEELKLDRGRYFVTGSCGKGNWANIPWIAIFDKTISISATRGYYIVILFKEDMSGFYLSLNQGYTWFEENFKKKEAKSKIKYISEKIRNQLELKETNISLNSNGALAKGYELGNIYSKYYEKKDEQIKNIKDDIWNMLDMLYKVELIVGTNWEEYNIKNLMNKNESIIEDFKNYYFKNKNEIENADYMIERKNNFKLFYLEYPFEKFMDLKLEDYVVGNNNINSLCYKMEFGQYKDCGPGIGGATAYKYGIFYSKEHQNYMYNRKVENEPEKRWDIIKNDLYKLFNNIANSKTIDEIEDNYDTLKGMSMFIIKLGFCYFPQKLIGVCGRKHLISLLDLFKFDYNENSSSLKLSFLFNYKLRQAIPELDNEDPEVIAHIVWMYLEENNIDEIENEGKNKVWTYSPGEGANKWSEFYNNGIMAINWNELGDLTQYETKEEIRKILSENRDTSNKNNALANWEFANEIQIGDIIYAKKGKNIIVGKGIVESDYMYDEERQDYKSYRKVKWIYNQEKNIKDQLGEQLANKTLTDVTKYTDFVNKLNSLYEDRMNINNTYTKYDFLNEVFISEEQYDTIINTLMRKKNIILQGAPGVGKTFCAKKIMYSLMNEKDDSRIEVVQFHQSYSYEDFIQGYRPNNEGKFTLKNGVFYNLVNEACKEYNRAKLANEEPKKFCIIIDEINRGNLSKVFGELMMLIESDKREKKWSLNLTYSDTKFYIPENLYIIGTMNTADRSLSMVDYALRRRFAFINLQPAFNNEKFKQYLVEKEKLDKKIVESLIDKYIKLNDYIKETLGKDFMIGHSYFIGQQLDIDNFDEIYRDIVNYEIKPLLEEYYYDDEEKIERALEIIK